MNRSVQNYNKEETPQNDDPMAKTSYNMKGFRKNNLGLSSPEKRRPMKE
jgi:hypothetical protein